MIWTETEVEVIVSDEMIDKIKEVVEGLDNLEDILLEYGFRFGTRNGNWFDYDDVYNAKELLETLADPRCEFEE